MVVYRFILMLGLCIVFAISTQSIQTRADYVASTSEELKYGPGWGVFVEIAHFTNVWDEIKSADRRIGDFMTVKPINLSEDADTFLAIGEDMPFLGARRQMHWVVRRKSLNRQGAKYSVIGDIGPIDQVIADPSGKRHNGYRDLLVTYPADNYDKASTVRMIFNGVMYK